MKKITLFLLIGFLGFSQIKEKDSIIAFVDNNTKLKENPSVTSYTTATLNNNEKVIITNYFNDFFEVIYNNKKYFINELWIKKTPEINKFITKKEEEAYQKKIIDLKKEEENTELKEKLELKNKKILEEKYIKKFGLKTYNKLKEGYYWIGMTKEMAIISLGDPKDINKTVTKTHISEQWVYDNIYLYFENGILETYQN